MMTIFRSATATLLFVMTAVGVCAAAEELHFDQTQWIVAEAASRELEIDIPQVSSKLADASSAVLIDYLVYPKLSFSARVERSADNAYRATVAGAAPTLFLRYFGIDSRPLTLEVEFKQSL